MFAHTDDVICLAMHPDGVTCATGQMGKKPSIVVWRTDTLAPVCVLEGMHRRAVCQLAFSPDGRCVVSVPGATLGAVCLTTACVTSG